MDLTLFEPFFPNQNKMGIFDMKRSSMFFDYKFTKSMSLHNLKDYQLQSSSSCFIRRRQSMDFSSYHSSSRSSSCCADGFPFYYNRYTPELRNPNEEITNGSQSDFPLLFHKVHGQNVILSDDKSRASRGDSFCKGICFSNRPISINERVYIRFVETCSSWSGVLRFGFTNIDPATLNSADLPRYACPDLTNMSGNWAKALGERYAESANLLFFYITRTGDVKYGINGVEKGLFFSGVSMIGPLWALLDIYGNTVSVEFANPDAVSSIPPSINNSSIGELMSSFQSMDLSHNNSTNNALTNVGSNMTPNNIKGLVPMIRFHKNVDFTPLFFHSVQGRNILLDVEKTVAMRRREEYCNGYVFTSRPVRNEVIVLQILAIDRSYVGGLAFGFTTCDPCCLTFNELPDDADQFLDRREYWVVNKDVCRSPDVGDELSFHLTPEGLIFLCTPKHKLKKTLHASKVTRAAKHLKYQISSDTFSMEESIATLTRHHEKTKKCLAPKSDSSDLEQQKASSFDFGMEENLSRTVARTRATKSYTKARSSSEGCLTFKKHQQNYITSKYILKDDPSLIKFSQKDFELPTDLTELSLTDITTSELQKDIKKLSVSEEEEDEGENGETSKERPRVPPPSPRRFLSCVDIEPSTNTDRSSDSETNEQCSTGSDEQTSEVRYARNTSKMTTLMHVDPTLPLWMFFDVYGNVQKIKILGSAHPSQIRRLRPASACLGNGSGLTVALPPRQCTTPTTPTPYHVSHSGPTNNNNNNNSSSSSSSSSTSSSSAAMSTLVLRSFSMPTSSFHHTSLTSASSLSNGAGGSHMYPQQQQQQQQAPTKVYSAPPMPPLHFNRGSQHNSHILYPSTSFESGLGPSIMSASNDNPIADNESNECNVCYERSINCVLYTCGHMCMCFECAMAVKKDRGALCPICRQHIKDVIKIFRS